MSEKSNDKNNINSRSEHLRKPTDTVKEIAEQLGIDPDLLTIAFKMHDEGHAYIGTTSPRPVELGEIRKVAEEGRTGSKEEAMNAVTTSKDEPTIENDGQSHDDE